MSVGRTAPGSRRRCSALLVVGALALPGARARRPRRRDGARREVRAGRARSSSRRRSAGYGETYEPIDVDLLFDEPTVALRGPWNVTDLVKIGPAAGDLDDRFEYHLDFPGSTLEPGCDYERWTSGSRGKRPRGLRARRDRGRRIPGSSRCSTGSSTPSTSSTTCTRATGR